MIAPNAKLPGWPVVVLAATLSLTAPIAAQEKDLSQLQEGIRTLRARMAQAQTSVDENIGLLTDHLKRNAANIQNMRLALQALQDQVPRNEWVPPEQIQKLVANHQELKVALQQFKAQADSFSPIPKAAPAHAIAQPPATPAVPAQRAHENGFVSDVPPSASLRESQPAPGAVSPQSANIELYNSALQHFAAKDFEIASNEFARYLKSDTESDNAINAYFYMAEIEFQEKDFEGALQDYTAIAARISDKTMAAKAQYKKALCLIEVDRKDEAVQELERLVEQYPNSPEAARAGRKIRELEGKKK